MKQAHRAISAVMTFAASASAFNNTGAPALNTRIMDIYLRGMETALIQLMPPPLAESAIATVTATVSITITETLTKHLVIHSAPNSAPFAPATIPNPPPASPTVELDKRWTTRSDIYECLLPRTTPTTKIKPFHKWTTGPRRYCTMPPATMPTRTITFHSTLVLQQNFYCTKYGTIERCGTDTHVPPISCTLTS